MTDPGPQPRYRSLRRPATAALASLCLLAGCQAAMSTSAQDKSPPSSTASPLEGGMHTNTSADWPLRFRAHNFGVTTYSTYGCKVVYNNMIRVDEPDDVLQSSSEAIGSKYPDNMSASAGPIRNFPPPAIVTWRSKDGTAHRAEVDMAEIFNDRLIRHKVAREDIPEQADIPPPGIILEVNDRTINVYMRAFISTKEPQIPGNKYSFSRYDLIKVYSHTY